MSFNGFFINSEDSLFYSTKGAISIENQRFCWGLANSIKELSEVASVVVGMNNILVHTKELEYSELLELKTKLDFMSKNAKSIEISGNTIEIPVDYGGELGVDLKDLARAKNMSVTEFVKLHSEPIYTVCFLGFLPGFVYLGGLDKRLFSPRLSTPRTSINAGSVGIGGEQTGIYPYASPGGWNIIGNTKIKLFDYKKCEPSLFKAGDRLKFVINSIKE